MSSPPPDMRIGDAEREDGLRALGEHMAAGRLTVDEYGERSAKVTTARTRSELSALFADLPEPRPRFGPAPQPVPMPAPPVPYMAARPPAQRALPILMPIAMVIGVVVAFRFGFFPALLIPALVVLLLTRSSRARWRP